MSNLSNPPSYGSGPYGSGSARPLTLFDMILPPQVFPLLALLFIITPLVILTGESLFIPLIEFTKSKLTLGSESNFDTLPFHFFVKLAAFLLLSFFGGLQLLLRINSTYYATWAKTFSRPHALHTDYHPHKDRSIMALMSWKGYRALMILVPPIIIIALTSLIGMAELYLFNVLGEFPFISLSIQLTVGVFVMMMLGMFCIFALLSSLWHIFTTLFGDVVAVTEPELSPKTIFDRSNRIAFFSPYAYALYLAYFALMLLFWGLVAWLVFSVDIYSLLRLEANVPLIMLCELVFFILYFTFNYFRFTVYHHALGMYYNKLPKQMKEYFSPPS